MRYNAHEVHGFNLSACAAGGDDFTLIESMNLAAGRQYREMAQYASGLVAVMDTLREKRARTFNTILAAVWLASSALSLSVMQELG